MDSPDLKNIDPKLKEKYEQIVGKPLPEIPVSPPPPPKEPEPASSSISPLISEPTPETADTLPDEKFHQKIALLIIAIGIILFVVIAVFWLRIFEFDFSIAPQASQTPLSSP